MSHTKEDWQTLSKRYCRGELLRRYGARILMYARVHSGSALRVSLHFSSAASLERGLLFMKEYEMSGLTKKEFCEQKVLSLAQLKYRWRTQLKERSKGTPKSSGSENGFEGISIRLNHSTETHSEQRVATLYFPNQMP